MSEVIGSVQRSYDAGGITTVIMRRETRQDLPTEIEKVLPEGGGASPSIIPAQIPV